MKPLLTIDQLSIHVGERQLLNAVSFEIGYSEIFALVGESGSGKSLTSLAVMRLLPEALTITGGDIVFEGASLFAYPEFQMQGIRGRSIAMIFQEPMSALNPVMSIGEQVAEVLRLHMGYTKDQVKAKVIALFEEVSLRDPLERYHWYPHQLSGGQKQRVMIAMALACEPTLLIADEPTTALDVTIQAQVLALLKTICEKRRLSILFITHDLAVVAQMADRVAVMQSGSILEVAECNAFFEAPQHPYSQALLESVRTKKLLYRSDEAVENLLQVEDLRVYFPIKKGILQRHVGDVRAVDGVSLTLPKGKTLALVGESGSGKSTIGKAILSLVEVTSGRILFGDEVLNGKSPRALRPYRQKIQVVFQDPFSALNPRMTIGEIIKEGMESLGVGPTSFKEQREYIEALLQRVELEKEHLHRYPHEFSGGQRQRIGIARALAVQPEVVICDEPTSALDVSVRAQVLGLLRRLQEEQGLSYLFITHDLSIVPMIADRVAVMKEGKIVEQGSVTEVFEAPKHTYTKHLLASAPKLPKIEEK